MTANEIMKNIKDNLDSVEQNLEQIQCDDCISRQAVQDYIAKYLSQYLYDDVREAVEVIDEYIGELPPVRPQEPKTEKWILVSERLPEKNRKYNTFLVTDSNGNLAISKFYLPLSNSDIDKPYWSGMIDVIAWMPLPEPYRAEGSENEK